MDNALEIRLQELYNTLYYKQNWVVWQGGLKSGKHHFENRTPGDRVLFYVSRPPAKTVDVI